MGKTKFLFTLIVFVHLATSQGLDDGATAEAPPCPPSSSSSSSSSVDLQPVSDMMGDGEVGTANKMTKAVVLAFLTFRKESKDEAALWKILVLVVVFPSAVWAIFVGENPLRNLYPRFANVFELFGIFFFNGVMASCLPKYYYWVPAVCLASSLLTLIIAPACFD